MAEPKRIGAFERNLTWWVLGCIVVGIGVGQWLPALSAAAGELKIDEIITQEYSLDQVQQGYEDQAAGTILRGVVKFDS